VGGRTSGSCGEKVVNDKDLIFLCKVEKIQKEGSTPLDSVTESSSGQVTHFHYSQSFVTTHTERLAAWDDAARDSPVTLAPHTSLQARARRAPPGRTAGRAVRAAVVCEARLIRRCVRARSPTIRRATRPTVLDEHLGSVPGGWALASAAAVA
jgi:hypothetical protein